MLPRLCRSVCTKSAVNRAFLTQTPVFSGQNAHLLSARCFSTKLDIKMVKKLRDMTGAPMLDCKNALTEATQQSETDQVEFAVDWLRKRGKAAAAKKAGRTASEGLVGVIVNDDHTRGAVIELNSETDFVAKNEMFHNLLFDILSASQNHPNPTTAEVMAAKSSVGEGTVDDNFTSVITALRENIQLRRISTLNASPGGKIAAYVHQTSGTQGNAKIGRIGCLVNVEPIKDGAVAGEALSEFGGKLAMHVAAGFPKYLTQNDVPAEEHKRETDLLNEQAQGSGKDQTVIDRMVAGRMNKYYEDNCLLNQKFLISADGSKQPAVEKVAEGQGMAVAGFARFECGQEIAGESV